MNNRHTPQTAIQYLVTIGWSQNKIALRFNIEPAMVSRLLHGQRVKCDYKVVDGLRDLIDNIETHHKGGLV